ncbi:Nn.00g002680.m01.CDS01 [Neocucurbitaria sp. VM-36]
MPPATCSAKRKHTLSTNYRKEARSARAEDITYRQALEAIHDRRHAFSHAYPFSARVLGQGNAFLYRQGILCMLEGDTVRISDVHATSDTIQLDLTAIIAPILESAFVSPGYFKVALLHYSDGILAVHAFGEGQANIDHIFAISTATHQPNAGRVIRAFHLESSSKLFVRHNAHYLYYGTHTGIGDDGHHKWEIDGISLHKNFPMPTRERPLLLENFHGTDIGSTIAFEMHNDYFYAVSNQGTFEVEEIDYTSFYHWVRFPVDQPLPEFVEKNERLYRRQHRQGPIHDSWTDLSLQLDERTNKTVIVESRREWAQASSRQSRTFYVTHLKSEEASSPSASSPTAEPSDGLLLPDDILASLVDSSNNPNYMHTPPQYSWSQHPEFSKHEVSPRSFILARTKFRAYNYSCTSFLDLVEDERCCNDPTKPPCLRLRIGSRREAPLDLPPSNPKGKERFDEMEPTFVDKTPYQHSPIRMWPPPASRCPCSKRLHDILSPPLPSGSSHSISVNGVLDSRSLVYMVKPGRSYGSSDDNLMGTIVLVDFSRPIISPGTGSVASTLMSRSDSKMEDEFKPSSWEWMPGLEKRCRSKTCR